MFGKYILAIFVVVAIFIIPALSWCGDTGTLQDIMLQIEQYAAHSTSRFAILIFIALFTLVSEDLACIAAGLLAAKTIITPVGAVAASALGIYVGDVLLYLAGYLVGVSALNHAPLKWLISQKSVQQSRKLFERRGAVLIIMCRFMPGTRTATFFAAGLVKADFLKLLLAFGVAVILWTPVLVLGSMYIGKEIISYAELYGDYALWVFLGLLLVLFIVTRLVVPLFSWRGRRLLVSKWRRLTRWEFWPYYVTNSVTFFYVLYLGLRYRSLTLFTIVNPVVKPDSGFIGERKSDILPGLLENSVGKWELIAGNKSLVEKKEIFVNFMKGYQLEFPVVLKPDRGQRGVGVEICMSHEEAYTWLEKSADDSMVMEFLPGEEFGVFYYRFPKEESGVIFSINRKKLLFVTGDGHHTLEELILTDDRALCMAPIFMDNFHSDLLRIVPKGERIQLGNVGAHSRGTLFLNGADLITPELRKAVDRIVRPYKGFYFGRFDFKTKNEESLKMGRDLKVIELNGVTSEATHIYDPSNSLFYAWKTLMKQWSIAFEIASENMQAGYRPMKIKDFITHWCRSGK